MSTNELQSYRLNDETIDQTKIDQSHLGMISVTHSSASTPIKIRTNEHSIREQIRGCNIDEMVIKDQSLDDQDNDEQRTSFNRQDVTTNSVAAEPTYASDMSLILGPNSLNDKTMKRQEELRMSSDKILIQAERSIDMMSFRKRQSHIRQSMELNAAGRIVSRRTEDQVDDYSSGGNHITNQMNTIPSRFNTIEIDATKVAQSEDHNYGEDEKLP